MLEPASAQKVRNAADKHVDQFAAIIMQGLEEARDEIDVVALETLLASGNRDAIEDYLFRPTVGLESRFAADPPIVAAILGTMADGASATQCEFGGPFTKPELAFKVKGATKEQIEAVWDKSLSKMKAEKIAEEMGLPQNIVNNIIYNAKKKQSALKKLITETLEPKPVPVAAIPKPPVFTPAPKPPASTFTPAPKPNIPSLDNLKINKVAQWDPNHVSGKSHDLFWYEKHKWHGFTMEEVAANLQITVEDAAKIIANGQFQSQTYVAPVKTYSNQFTKAYKPAATPQPTAGPGAEGWPIGDSVPRAMGSKYPSQVEARFQEWAKKLTSAEQDAISNYTGSSYHSINGKLRQGTLDPYTKKVADNITEALNKASNLTPPPPELVWRGISGFPGTQFQSLGVGDVIEMTGFQSTSINPAFAASWGGIGEGTSEGILFEIMPKAGAYIRPLSQAPSEYEFLLPHGAKYRVRGRGVVTFADRYGRDVTKVVTQLEML